MACSLAGTGVGRLHLERDRASIITDSASHHRDVGKLAFLYSAKRLGPGAWGLEPRAWSLELGAWSLELKTWGLKPPARGSVGVSLDSPFPFEYFFCWPTA